MALLELDQISKRFGATIALDGVSLSVEAGQVVCLVGENGSGKSTLMRIVSGAIAPDGGSMAFADAPFRPTGPLDSQRAGIAMIHQELAQCSHLTVGENIFLGMEPRRGGVIDYAEVRRRSREALDQLGASDVNPDQRLGSLPIDQRQLVELARAIASNSRVVILDEPTSSLGKSEVERLFEVIDKLRAAGKAVVYISHFLEEVQRVADRVVVLRDGRLVGDSPKMSNEEIVANMVGRRVDDIYPRSSRAAGQLLLEVSDVSGIRKPIHANLAVHAGEIVGIMGLNGSGRSELLRTIFGLDRVRSGTIRVGGNVVRPTPRQSWRRKVGMLSEDRKEEGLSLEQSIAENITLTALDRFTVAGLIDDDKQRKAAETWVAQLRVKCASALQPIGALSGGNQQKAAIARMLFHDVDVLLLDEPTRGIDIGSKEQIYELIDQLALAGKGILLVSSYLPELMGLCDRIHVMKNGSLGSAHRRIDVTAEDLMREATI